MARSTRDAGPRGHRLAADVEARCVVAGTGGILDQLLEEVLGRGHDADVVIRQLGLPGDVGDRVAEAADPVDQAELQRLPAGEDPAAGQLVDRLLEPAAADRLDVALEDVVDVVHPVLHPLAFAAR